MKNKQKILTIFSLCLLSFVQTVKAENIEALIAKGNLIFEDDFNREGGFNIGNEWFVNNKDGAAKQAELKNGLLIVKKAPELSHSTVVRHDAPFDNGAVKLRFRLFDKAGLKLNFNDPAAKKVAWAGHIMRVVIQPGQVTISDDLTGTYDLTVRDKRKNPNLEKGEREKLEKFIKSTKPVFKAKVDIGEWHELTMLNIGPKVEVFIDNKSVGSFSSKGLDHKVKQNIVFGVVGHVDVDKLQVWSLD